MKSNVKNRQRTVPHIAPKKSRMRRLQRKRRALAPLHKRQDMVSAHLSKELRKTVSRRALRIKNGYIVKVVRGENKGKEGKVTKVALRQGKIAVEGITSKKADGKEVPILLDPSNVLIIKVESESPKPTKQQV